MQAINDMMQIMTDYYEQAKTDAERDKIKYWVLAMYDSLDSNGYDFVNKLTIFHS